MLSLFEIAVTLITLIGISSDTTIAATWKTTAFLPGLRHNKRATRTAQQLWTGTGRDPSFSTISWEEDLGGAFNPYRSPSLFEDEAEWEAFLDSFQERQNATAASSPLDPFWEQIKLEAMLALQVEPEAGPQIYQGILSQPDLITSIASVISHQIETELIPATAIRSQFLNLLTTHDEHCIRWDLQAAATRSRTYDNAMGALLFHNGFHALVCYRVGHRLWQANRTGLAYYMQSTVSRTYAADIHPACRMGCGIFLRAGSGVVIGETAVLGDDVCILEGVTLGGTGKEAGDRHPKVGSGVIIQDGGTVLGNIKVGDGAIVTAKSIVNKPVPPLAIVTGVPARIQGFRELEDEDAFQDVLQSHLAEKYLTQWKEERRRQLQAAAAELSKTK